MILERIACLVIGYVFGLFQTGFLYGKSQHIDIRNYGSGNSGTTNAMRVLGRKAGVVVFLGDALKALFACLFVQLLFGAAHPEAVLLFKLYAGLGVVLGHNFPFYLKFKGGKGIAATVGVLAALGDWRIFLSCVIAFFAVAFTTRYVSVGSMVILGLFLIEWVCFCLNGTPNIGKALMTESIVLVACFAALGVFQHRANIVRLMNGTENKIGAKKKE